MSKRERLKEAVRVATERTEKLAAKLYEAEKDLTAAVIAVRDHDNAAWKAREKDERVPPAVYMQGMLEGLVENIRGRIAIVHESKSLTAQESRHVISELTSLKGHLESLLTAQRPVANDKAIRDAMKDLTRQNRREGL